MKVILTQDVKGQGKKDDVIEVSDGYARNFLIKNKLAVEATSAMINSIKIKKPPRRGKSRRSRTRQKDFGNHRRRKNQGRRNGQTFRRAQHASRCRRAQRSGLRHRPQEDRSSRRYKNGRSLRNYGQAVRRSFGKNQSFGRGSLTGRRYG